MVCVCGFCTIIHRYPITVESFGGIADVSAHMFQPTAGQMFSKLYFIVTLLDSQLFFQVRQNVCRCRHAVSTEPLTRWHLIWCHLVSHSTGPFSHLSSKTHFSKEMKYSNILNPWYYLWTLFFDMDHPNFIQSTWGRLSLPTNDIGLATSLVDVLLRHNI